MKISYPKFVACVECEWLIPCDELSHGDITICPNCNTEQKIGFYKSESFKESVENMLDRTNVHG